MKAYRLLFDVKTLALCQVALRQLPFIHAFHLKLICICFILSNPIAILLAQLPLICIVLLKIEMCVSLRFDFVVGMAFAGGLSRRDTTAKRHKNCNFVHKARAKAFRSCQRKKQVCWRCSGFFRRVPRSRTFFKDEAILLDVITIVLCARSTS